MAEDRDQDYGLVGYSPKHCVNIVGVNTRAWKARKIVKVARANGAARPKRDDKGNVEDGVVVLFRGDKVEQHLSITELEKLEPSHRRGDDNREERTTA